MSIVRLRAGNVQPVWAGHPWVFAQAIEHVTGAPAAGDEVRVVDPRGQLLGRGYWSPDSAIPVRILTQGDEPLDAAWMGRRLEEAMRLRHALGLPSTVTDGYRLVHAEGDGLPGLIVDVFRDVAVVQLLTIGMKRREDAIFAEVARVTGARSVVEVGSERSAELEGFEAESRVVRGPDVPVLRFRERAFEHEVELGDAQKTGFFFDQRDNRALVETLAHGRTVLDAFSYTGGFALAAARGGATKVRAIDSSATAVAQGAQSAHRHGLDARIDFVKQDVKRALPELHAEGARFDVVILDPPKLVPTTRHLERGRTAYRKLNAAGIRVLAPGGLLVTCSCSAAFRSPDFVRTVALAARDCGRTAYVLYEGRQGPDHPVPAAFPEGHYLKCLVLRIA